MAFEITKTKERNLKKQRQKRNTHSLPLYGQKKNPTIPTVSLTPSPRATRRIRTSPAVLSVRPCTGKLDEEKIQNISLSCHLQEQQTRRIRTSPAVLSVTPCTEKLDEANSKHAGLAQENGFVPAHLHSLLKASERQSKAMHLPVSEGCNEYDLTATPCF